jgi:DNA mismatch endonuclease (patch repair protein)
MRGNRKRDTQPEMRIRRRLHSLGYRYVVDRRPLPGRFPVADLLFPRRRVAVFVDGCFWHGCQEHFKVPSTNVAYWEVKIARNRSRDIQSTQMLVEAGWRVVRVWEHEPNHVAVARIVEALAD